MSRSPVRILFVAAALAVSLPLAAAAAGTATLAPVGLPSAKAALQEFKYSFGKDWESAIRAQVKEDLAATKLFSDIVPEGGELTFTLDVQEAKRTWDEHIKQSGKGTLTFTAKGSFSWKRGESALSEGTFDLRHQVSLDREPWRTDLSDGWREILRRSVQDAVDKGHAAGVFRP